MGDGFPALILVAFESGDFRIRTPNVIWQDVLDQVPVATEVPTHANRLSWQHWQIGLDL